MTRFIKIFTIMTGLSLMTACGASGLVDDLKSILEQAQAALSAVIKKDVLDERLIEERLAAEIEANNLDEAAQVAARARITEEVAGLSLAEIESELNLSEDQLAEINAEVERTANLCAQNPFNDLCDGNATYKTTRDAIKATCTRNLDTSNNCSNFVVFVCERDDPYNPICTQGENDYASFQANITDNCIRDDTGPLCDRAVAATCTKDAFHRLCLTDLANEYNQGAGFSAARALVCDLDTGSAPDSDQCTSAVRIVCSRNPLDAVCANRDEYFVARDNFCWIQGIDGSTRNAECAEIYRVNNLPENAIPACRANYVDPTGANRFNPRCYNVVIPICNVNPFDDICDRNTNFTNRHDRIIIDCRAEEEDATFCAEAKTSVCDDNPFDELCFLDYTSSNYPTNNDYESERNTAITECGQTFVAGKRCLGAAEQSCRSVTGEGLFASLCLNDPNTDTARQPACVGDRPTADSPVTPRCATTATRICDGDPLDPLCDGVDGYFEAQLSACILDSNNRSCVVGGEFQFAAIEPIAACLKTPFAAACLDIATPQGEFFAPRAEAAQDAYCESGGARTASTNVETTADRVNCTNIGSLPVFASLARDITQNGVRTVSTGENPVVTNEVTVDNPNIGGFLRTGVFGTRLGDHKGTNGATYTDENNNGNFDRADPTGGDWTGLPGDFGAGGPGRIFENNASKVDPKDGFTYFLAEEAPNFLSYAGIWQTTNFGAPLALQPAGDNGNITAIWKGNFTPATSGGVVLTLIENGEPLAVPLYNPDTVQTRVRLNDRTTDFYVDFTDGKFNFYNKVAQDGTGIVFGYTLSGGTGPQRKVPKRLNYSLDGYFGTTDPNDASRTLNPGELGGNVTLVIQPLKESDGTNMGVAGTPIVMPLTGLIGVEGAVGIFLNPNPSNSPNVGGFTAAPAPAE